MILLKPLKRFQFQLDYYGIRGSTHRWINLLLSGGHSTSSFRWPSLRSSQSAAQCARGICLRFGPVLHLHITSGILFADDCVLYRNIHSFPDCLILQEDLTSWGQWEVNWQMKYNVDKCHSMSVIRHQHHKYFLTIHYTIKLWKMFSWQNTLV